jgi:hypothetical protein
MRCRQCGTEIADRALICYRCGTATTEPKFQPPLPSSRRSPPRRLVVGALALVLLILLALLLLLSRSCVTRTRAERGLGCIDPDTTCVARVSGDRLALTADL